MTACDEVLRRCEIWAEDEQRKHGLKKLLRKKSAGAQGKTVLQLVSQFWSSGNVMKRMLSLHRLLGLNVAELLEDVAKIPTSVYEEVLDVLWMPW